MNNHKKMLLISYLFPPIGGGGVPRPLKMAKYLANLGWEVHVLTVDSSYHATKDDSLLKQLPPNVIVHRAREWNLLNGVRRFTRKMSEENVTSTGEIQRPGLSKKIVVKILTILRRVKNTLMIPDDNIGWLPSARKLGIRVVREHRIPMMFSTSGPNTSHLVARSIKRKTGIHWIADFRDPWTQNMHRTEIPWREALEEELERSVMREADGITTVTHGFADNFLLKFSKEINKLQVIHNGFDPEDYLDIEEGKEDHLFVLIYTGIFYKQRNPRLLFQGVKELIDEGKVDPSHIKLRFAGVFDYPGYSDNWDCVKDLHLENIVEIMGNLPHRQALASMKKADVLLLIGDTAEGSGIYIPGKLYEYMAIGHPILALSLEGESTGIIRKFQLGEVVNPQDKEEIKEAFLRMYTKWLTNKKEFDLPSMLDRVEEGDLSIYNRRVQAEMLSDLMLDILSKKKPL